MIYRDVANCFGKWDTEEVSDYSELIGFAIFPLASFFNHSREPNLRRSMVNGNLEFSEREDRSFSTISPISVECLGILCD